VSKDFSLSIGTASEGCRISQRFSLMADDRIRIELVKWTHFAVDDVTGEPVISPEIAKALSSASLPLWRWNYYVLVNEDDLEEPLKVINQLKLNFLDVPEIINAMPWHGGVTYASCERGVLKVGCDYSHAQDVMDCEDGVTLDFLKVRKDAVTTAIHYLHLMKERSNKR
jgi:hypothetical protein